MMAEIIHADAPEKDQARQDADALAASLGAQYPGYRVRVAELINSQFEVCLAVPFRTVRLTWAERQAGPSR